MLSDSGHISKKVVVYVKESPCHVGTGLLALRTGTLFTPAPVKGTGVSIYLSIYLRKNVRFSANGLGAKSEYQKH